MRLRVERGGTLRLYTPECVVGTCAPHDGGPDKKVLAVRRARGRGWRIYRFDLPRLNVTFLTDSGRILPARLVRAPATTFPIDLSPVATMRSVTWVVVVGVAPF